MLLVLSITHYILLLCSTALNTCGTRDYECCSGCSPNPNMLQFSTMHIHFSAATFINSLFIKLISLTRLNVLLVNRHRLKNAVLQLYTSFLFSKTIKIFICSDLVCYWCYNVILMHRKFIKSRTWSFMILELREAESKVPASGKKTFGIALHRWRQKGKTWGSGNIL